MSLPAVLRAPPSPVWKLAKNPVVTDSLDFPNAFLKLLHLDSILYLRKVSKVIKSVY